MIKNFSQLKKYFNSPNAEVEMIYYKFGVPAKFQGLKRKVQKAQTNAVQFVGGSWLYYDKAGNYVFHDDNTFDVLEDGEILLSYRYS